MEIARLTLDMMARCGSMGTHVILSSVVVYLGPIRRELQSEKLCREVVFSVCNILVNIASAIMITFGSL